MRQYAQWWKLLIRRVCECVMRERNCAITGFFRMLEARDTLTFHLKPTNSIHFKNCTIFYHFVLLFTPYNFVFHHLKKSSLENYLPTQCWTFCLWSFDYHITLLCFLIRYSFICYHSLSMHLLRNEIILHVF